MLAEVAAVGPPLAVGGALLPDDRDRSAADQARDTEHSEVMFMAPSLILCKLPVDVQRQTLCDAIFFMPSPSVALKFAWTCSA